MVGGGGGGGLDAHLAILFGHDSRTCSWFWRWRSIRRARSRPKLSNGQPSSHQQSTRCSPLGHTCWSSSGCLPRRLRRSFRSRSATRWASVGARKFLDSGTRSRSLNSSGTWRSVPWLHLFWHLRPNLHPRQDPPPALLHHS